MGGGPRGKSREVYRPESAEARENLTARAGAAAHSTVVPLRPPSLSKVLRSMGTRFAALLTCLAVLGPLPRAAHAEWHKRTDAIMGTRIYVELWDTDKTHGEASIDAVMAEMTRIDVLMS